MWTPDAVKDVIDHVFLVAAQYTVAYVGLTILVGIFFYGDDDAED